MLGEYFNKYLGLPFDENKIDAHLDEKIRGQIKKAENLPADKKAGGRATLLEKIEGKGSKTGTFLPFRPAITLGLATAAVAIVVVFALNLRHDTQVFLTVDSKKINLKRKFSQRSIRLARAAKIGDDISLWFRGIKGLTGRQQGGTLDLEFEKGVIAVSYHGDVAKRTLRIRVPGASFRVMGTRFVIRANGHSARLVVIDGKVQAKRKGQKAAKVKAKRSWDSKTGKVRKTPKARQLLKDFKRIKGFIYFADYLSSLKKSKPPRRKKKRGKRRQTAKVKLLVILKNGEKVKGVLVSEDANVVRIDTAFSGVFEIPKSQIERRVRE